MSSPFDSQHEQIRARIFHYADLYGIDRNIAIWQIWQESKFNPRANSGKAQGIAQFTPGTAARFGLKNVWDVDQSLNAWGKYMSFLLNMFGGRYELALAGYNAGENRDSLKRGEIPNIAETRNYVSKILTNAGSSTTGATGATVATGATAAAAIAAVFLILALT